MLKHFALFLLFTTLCINSASATGTCSATENNCEIGEWCETFQGTETTYTCSMCTIKPDGAQFTGDGGDSNNCPWTITCTAGYVWNESENKCKSCPEGYTSAPITVIYDGAGYDTTPATIPQCVLPTVDCTTVLSTTAQTSCTNNGGTVGGTTAFDDNAGRYNYKTCTCTKSVTIDHGTGRQECHYNAAGTALDTGSCTTTVTTCALGYCNKSGTDTCGLVEAGYYSVGTEPTCNKCPAGTTTSTTGSTGPGSCKYYNANTVFTDSAGSFSLPADNIQIKWNWQQSGN